MLVPLYGFLEGDTLGLVLLVSDSQTIRELAACMQQASAPRVPPRDEVQVFFNGQQLALDDTVAATGLEALDRVDIRVGGQP